MSDRMSVRQSTAFVIWLLFCGLTARFTTAQAAMVSYDGGGNVITVLDSTGVPNISTLYSELVKEYGETAVNANMLTLVDVPGKIWLSKAVIDVPQPGNFLVSDADVVELRVGKGGQNNSWALSGYIAFRNVRVASWNVAENRYSDYREGGRCTLYSEAHDTEFYGFEGIYFGYLYGKSIKDLSYTNLTLDHSKNGLFFQQADHITVDHALIKNGDPLFGGGVMDSQMNNSTLSDIRVIDASDKELGATGAYGLQLYGSNNTIRDVYISSISYSGVLLGGSHVNVTSMTVIDSGHNGFEINAGATDIYLKDITVKNSANINFFQVGRTEDGTTTGNITWQNLRSENPGGHAMIVAEGSYDTIVKDSVFLGHPASASNSKNVTFLNCLSDGLNEFGNDAYGFKTYLYVGSDYPNTFVYNENHKFIDCKVQNVYYRDFGFLDTKNVRIINQASTDVGLERSDYAKYDYIDVQVVDAANTPVTGARVTFMNEIDPVWSSVDGWGIDKSIFVTGADGHVPLPDADRAGSPAIAEFHASTSTVVHFSYRITAESNGLIASAAGVAPAASWYRADPDVSTNTIIIKLPVRSADAGGCLSFISPAAGAVVSERTTVELSTASVAMAKVDLYIDNTLVVVLSTASFRWEWDPVTAAAGEHTIKAVGYDGSGNGYYAEVAVRVVRTTGEIVPPNISGTGERVYPNPYIKGKSTGGKIVFANLPKESVVRVYTLSAEPVVTLRHGQTTDGGSEEWNISGMSGGIYMYTITAVGTTAKGKLGIIK